MKRKRGKNKMAGVPKYTGVPLEVLKEQFDAGRQNWVLRIYRRNDKGHLARVGSDVVVDFETFLNIESGLFASAGGGRFDLMVFDAEETTKHLFNVALAIEGAPKQLHALGTRAGGLFKDQLIAVQQQETNMQQQDPPNSPFHQGPHFAGQRPAAPMASHSSDEVALKQLESVRQEKLMLAAQVEKERAENARIREETNAKFEQLRIDQDKRDRESAEKAHAAEIRRLEDMIKMQRENAKPPVSISEVITAAVGFAPVIVAMISSKTDSEKLAIDRQNKMLEAQMAGNRELINATLAQRGDGMKGLIDGIKVLGPMLTPVLTSIITSKGPAAQAELVAAQAEAQLQQLGMVAEIVNAQAGDDMSPGMAIAKTVMDGIVQGAAAIAEAQKAKRGPTVTQQLAQGAQQFLNGQPAPQQIPVQAQAAQPAQAAAGEPPLSQGEQIANSILQHPMIPEAFKTQEWFSLFAAVHDLDPVDHVAEQIATHIGNLEMKKALPDLLKPIWDEPEETLNRLLSFLPIFQMNKQYMDTLIEKVVAELSDDGDANDAPEETAPAIASA